MELPKLSTTQIYQDTGNNTSEDLGHQSLKMKHVLKTTSQKHKFRRQPDSMLAICRIAAKTNGRK